MTPAAHAVKKPNKLDEKGSRTVFMLFLTFDAVSQVGNGKRASVPKRSTQIVGPSQVV
jgi:hypothetical protein